MVVDAIVFMKDSLGCSNKLMSSHKILIKSLLCHLFVHVMCGIFLKMYLWYIIIYIDLVSISSKYSFHEVKYSDHKIDDVIDL